MTGILDENVYRLSTGGPAVIVTRGEFWHEGCAGLTVKQLRTALLLSHKPPLESERCGKCGKDLRHWLARKNHVID